MLSRNRYTKTLVFTLGLVLVFGTASILFADEDKIENVGGPVNQNELPQNTILPPNTWSLSKKEIKTKYRSNNIPNPTAVQGKPVLQNNAPPQKIILLEEKKEYNLHDMPNISPVPIIGINLAPKHKQPAVAPASNSNQGQSLKGFVVKARCEINDTVTFSLHKRYVDGTCLLLNAKFRGQRFVNANIELIPDPANYRAVARIKSIEGTPVTTIRVINSKTYGENVAIVNKRILENILLAAARDTGSEIAQIIYQDAEEAGTAYASSTIYGTGAGSSSYSVSYPSFQEQMKQIPQAALYLGGANLLNEASQQILSNLPSLPPIFKVVRGTRLQVEFYPYKVNQETYYASQPSPSEYPTTQAYQQSVTSPSYPQQYPQTQYPPTPVRYYNTQQPTPEYPPQPIYQQQPMSQPQPIYQQPAEYPPQP